MHSSSRRKFLKLTAGGAASIALGGLLGPACHRSRAAKTANRSRIRRRPRYYIHILLSGGHDTVYSTDPKRKSEVKPNINLPAKNHIVERGNLRLGPGLAPLAPFADRIALLNGVQVGTANHDTGLKQFIRAKTNVAIRMPGAVDIIGAHRDGQPLGTAYLNVSQRVLHSPAYIGTADKFYFGSKDLFTEAEQTDPDDLALVAKTLHRQAQSLRKTSADGSEGAITANHIEQAANFFDRIPKVEPYKPLKRSGDYVALSIKESFHRALWLIENDLTCGVVIDAGLLGWDTHIDNGPRQDGMNGNFVADLRDFLAALDKTKNEHGLLADQTALVLGSELGRFPRLNDMLGKDHLPQTGYMFIGKHFVGGQAYGQTGREMEAIPISLKTGKGAGKSPGGHMTILDDVGATMMALAGLDPERYGYDGAVYNFLLAS